MPAARSPRCRETGAYGGDWPAIRERVLAKAKFCVGWPRGIHGPRKVRTTSVDHEPPLSRGGSHAASVLTALCGACNSRKAIEREGARGGSEGWRRGR